MITNHQTTGVRRGRRPRRLLVLAGAVSMLAAACGDDGGSASDTTAAQETTVETTIADTTVPATTAAATTTAAASTTVAPVTTAATATTAAGTTATTKAAATTTKAATTTVATTTASTAPGKPTKSTIVLGVPVGITGAGGATQKIQPDVALAWQEWVNNDKGGINGHPVKVVIKDLKGDSAAANAVPKDMMENDKIIAAVGGSDSSTEAVWIKVFTDAKVPVIGGVCYSTTVCTALPGFFHITTGLPGSSQVQVVAGKAIGATKMGRIATGSIQSSQAADATFRATADSVGIPYTATIPVDITSPSYTAECLNMKNAGVDYVQMSVSANVIERFVDDCGKQNYFPQWGASGGSFDESILGPISKNKSTTFAGGINSFPWWVNTAPVKEYRDVMAKYAPGKEYRNPNASGTWASLELFRKVMANASDNPTSAEVMTAMNNVKNETLGGLIPQPVTFTAGQPSPQMSCFWLYKEQNGTLTGGQSPSCYP